MTNCARPASTTTPAGEPPSLNGGQRWIESQTHRRWLIDEANRLMDFYQAGITDPRGGFYDLDDHGRPLPTGWPPAEAPKRSLFSTARMVHCLALGHLMGRPGSDAFVDHGMRALWEIHRDQQHGGYHWSNGHTAPVDATKQAYGHAFVMLAASSAKAAGHPDADRLLDDVGTVVDEHFWDERHGVMREEFQEDWSPLGTYRGQNSNMHFTEALMAAAEVTGDTRYVDRATRITTLLIREKTATNQWRLPEHYHEDWSIDFDYDRDVFRPYGSTPGHWLEWSRLLVQLWELTDRREEWMLSAARRLFEQGVHEGWDSDRGGFFFTVDWEGKPVDRDRYWWPCAEGIGAAAVLAATTATTATAATTADGLYEAWYRRIWNFSERHLIDRQHGSWHHQLDDRLQPKTDPWYGKPDLYHSLQACLIPLLPTASTAVAMRDSGARLA